MKDTMKATSLLGTAALLGCVVSSAVAQDKAKDQSAAKSGRESNVDVQASAIDGLGQVAQDDLPKSFAAAIASLKNDIGRKASNEEAYVRSFSTVVRSDENQVTKHTGLAKLLADFPRDIAPSKADLLGEISDKPTQQARAIAQIAGESLGKVASSRDAGVRAIQ